MTFKVDGIDLNTTHGDTFELLDQYVGGQLWLQGDNIKGQLGDNSIVRKSSPVQTIAGGVNWKEVSVGMDLSGGIKTDGTLWMWGNNHYGELGNNTSSNTYSSPVQTVAGGTTWKLISVGAYAAAAIKTDGTLWLWGGGGYGALGNNNSINVSSPIQTVSAGKNWKTVSTGFDCTAAIKTDGTLWLWGRNSYGQLGLNDITTRSSPTQVTGGGTTWKHVCVGNILGGSYTDLHTAAIKTDGTLWLWGKGTSGQLGDNTAVTKSSPVQTIAGGTDWKQVSLGDSHSTAIKTNGTLWVWGQGANGQLGDGTNVSKSSPVQTVAGGSNWKQVGAGGVNTSAIKTDGTLWVWGSNFRGQLGDGTVIGKSSPIQTIVGNCWKSCASGKYIIAATTFKDK